jgi:DNA polymerase
VQALLCLEQIPHCVWEPAAGRGAIVRVLRDRGHAVIASDIINYDFTLHFVGDFLTVTEVPVGTELIHVHAINSVVDATMTLQRVLHRDYETRSVLELPKVGPWKYASDSRTEVKCCAYAVDDGPVKLWLPGDPVPAEFIEAARNPNWLVCAHNDAFEAAIEQHIMGPRYGWPQIQIERHRCTMAMAQALSLPGKLELVARALDQIHQKDKAGARLMHTMSKPRRPHKDEDPNAGPYYFDDEDRLQRWYQYCRQDLEVERELYSRLRPLHPSEQHVWQLDFRINCRGFYVDRALAEPARAIAEAAGPEIDAELAQLTGGAVTGVNQVARLKAWLAAQGHPSETLDNDAIETLLEFPQLPGCVRRVLELRQGGAQAAAKKVDALLTRCDADGRIRGALRYHGASTGRWAGNGLQPQNLKRPEIEDVDAAIAAVSTGDYAHVRKLYPQPLAVIGDLTRSLICAAPGHVLIGADFSSIESRVLAWVACENWKLDSYRRYDATQDPRDEPYTVTAAKIFGKPAAAITPDERKAGKVCDLAFGYQGGLRAFRNFEPEPFTDPEVEQFKQDWRAAHPNIKKFWYDIDLAAWRAVRERGEIVRCGRIAFKCEGAYLFLKLPSTRKLAYPFPRIKIEDPKHQVVVFKDNAAGQWRDCRNGDGAYGGLWAENIVSAISRDLLASALMRIEAAGYPIVLHVHDEVIAEVPEGFGSAIEFIKLMTTLPSWALGLPVAAKAWSGKRFCK